MDKDTTRMTTAQMVTEAGPVDGIEMIYDAVRTGAITKSEFAECLQAIVAQAVMGLEDMEDEAVVMSALISAEQLPVC